MERQQELEKGEKAKGETRRKGREMRDNEALIQRHSCL